MITVKLNVLLPHDDGFSHGLKKMTYLPFVTRVKDTPKVQFYISISPQE